MAAGRDLRQRHAVGLDVAQVGQRRVLLPVHEQPWTRQAEEPVHQAAVVRQVDHRFENPPHGAGAHLVAQARGIQGAGVGRRVPGPLAERIEEAFGVGLGVADDLPAEEAVFRRDVAFDVGEAQHAVRPSAGEHQRGEPAHGVADQVERPPAEVIEHGLGGLDQEGDRDPREVRAGGLAAARRVVGDERAAIEGRVAHDVGVVFLGRAEAVQEQDRRAIAGAVDGREVQCRAVHDERQPHVGEFALRMHVSCSCKKNKGAPRGAAHPQLLQPARLM